MSSRGHAGGDPDARADRPRPRRLAPRRSALILRGAAAAVTLVVLALVVVGYGNGYFRSDPDVTAVVPAEAGLLAGTVPVQHDGVEVGEVSAIEAGTEESLVRLTIDRDLIDTIPAGVVARVAPRTLFGDVLIELVPDPDWEDSAGAEDPRHGRDAHLRDGDRLRTDTSDEAAELYDVYQRAVGLMDRLEPQRMQAALTAAATALDGQGEALGRSLDRFAEASGRLTPVAESVLDRGPAIASVAQAAREAAPDGLGVLRDVARLSQVALGEPGAVGTLFGSAAGTMEAADSATRGRSDTVQRVIDQSGPVLGTMDARRGGIMDSLDAIRSFSEEGAGVFAKGRFDVTAVLSFADPEPYTPADCPQYGALAGAGCADEGGG